MSIDRQPSTPFPSSNEILLSMFSDALGFEVTFETELTPEQEVMAGAIVQSRLDGVREEMEKMQRGEQVDVDKLMDSKAQCALFEISLERKAEQ